MSDSYSLIPLNASDNIPNGEASEMLGNVDTTVVQSIKKRHKVRIEHKLPGRIRMKIPKAEHRPEILEAYKQAFLAIPGVIGVRTNTEASNIVINYDTKREAEFHQHFDASCAEHNMSVNLSLPGNEFKEMTKKIEAEAEFLAERSHFVRVTVDFFKVLDYQIKVVTGNAIDLKILLAGGLAVATFVEIGAEAATPMWVTLALFGVNHFIEMKQEPLHAPLANSASLK